MPIQPETAENVRDNQRLQKVADTTRLQKIAKMSDFVKWPIRRKPQFAQQDREKTEEKDGEREKKKKLIKLGSREALFF